MIPLKMHVVPLLHPDDMNVDAPEDSNGVDHVSGSSHASGNASAADVWRDAAPRAGRDELRDEDFASVCIVVLGDAPLFESRRLAPTDARHRGAKRAPPLRASTRHFGPSVVQQREADDPPLTDRRRRLIDDARRDARDPRLDRTPLRAPPTSPSPRALRSPESTLHLRLDAAPPPRRAPLVVPRVDPFVDNTDRNHQLRTTTSSPRPPCASFIHLVATRAHFSAPRAPNDTPRDDQSRTRRTLAPVSTQIAGTGTGTGTGRGRGASNVSGIPGTPSQETGDAADRDENGPCAWRDGNRDEERRERLSAEELRLAASRPLDE
jgi:hypothetical protein